MEAGRIDVVSEARDGGVAIVRVRGEIDLATAEEFGANLAMQDRDKPLVLDLSGVTFMDSSGLGTLLTDAKERDSIAVVVAEGSAVERLFDLAGIGDYLPHHPSEEEALAALDG